MSPPWYDRFVGVREANPTGAPREILVIDDQPEAREMIGLSLQRLGWVVHLAANAADAMAIMKASHGSLGLALVDVVMPDMDGMSLARRLRAAHPRLGIILVSGKLNDESRWIVSEEGFRFLPKPFKLRQLGDMVASVLGDLDSSVSP